MDQTLVSILTGILIAGATSWITVQLSLRQFRSQKWWEKKVDAYTRILNALHQLKKSSNEHLEAEYRGRTVGEERAEELKELSKKSREELKSAMDIGAFLLSDKAVKVLDEYESQIDNLDQIESWFEYIDYLNAINQKTLKKIIPIARKDLKQ
ncbi:MAG: hypothetical protein HN392_00385 [Anaerolineae bacterium]|nr:hypothetical protein [Anaerolineae bacterium]